MPTKRPNQSIRKRRSIRRGSRARGEEEIGEEGGVSIIQGSRGRVGAGVVMWVLDLIGIISDLEDILLKVSRRKSHKGKGSLPCSAQGLTCVPGLSKCPSRGGAT